jgi:hypothetical protein
MRLVCTVVLLFGLTAPAFADETARKACVDAMNADPSFADSIILLTEKKLNEKVDDQQILKDACTRFDHNEAADAIRTNERHVLLAYMAMWLVAAGLVLYLWRKQQALKGEIALLRKDLEAALADDKSKDSK